MNEFKKKLNRVRPIIRVRKAIVEKETLVLAQLRQQKQHLSFELQKSQSDYLSGVKQLNAIRQSSDRMGQSTYENCVSFARDKWIKLYRQVQLMEKQIEAQLHSITKAQNQLKLVEKLETKYELAWRQHLSKKEQDLLDERAAMNYHRRR